MTDRYKAGTGQKIERLFAWVAEDEDGGEGIIGGPVPGIAGLVPMIGADLARMQSYRPTVELLAKVSGQKLTLKQFSTVTILEEIGT